MSLAIAVACIASLYQIYALGWRGVRLASLDRAAIEVAKNQLASAGVETTLEEGTVSGVSPEGVAWTSEIQRYNSFDSSDASLVLGSNAAVLPEAFWVRVKVVWNEGPTRPTRYLELQTLKLKSLP